jgi:uncharacterized protein YyaL (SSP411 family)
MPVEKSIDESAPRLVGLVAASYDSARGGFIGGYGVPDESAIDLAFRLGRDGRPGWHDWARQSVTTSWALYDTTYGGFYQFMNASKVGQGEFEKRTDSNARRLENRVDAWLDGHDERDTRAIHSQLEFFERVLEDGRGGFVAAQIGDRDLVPASNGYAAHAYLTWAAASGETRWRDFALKSLDRLWNTGWNEQLGLLQRDPFGNMKAMPRLADHVEIGRALVLAAHLVGRESDVDRARIIANFMLARFEDPVAGGMRSQAVPAKDGSIKKAPRESYGNARAARFLAELANLTGDASYRDAARRLVTEFVPQVSHPGPECAEWALAMRAIEKSELPERPKWQEPPAAPKPPPRSIKIKSGGKG